MECDRLKSLVDSTYLKEAAMKKDMSNKMIFGVCSGIAREMKTDPTIIRAIFAILTLMGFGLPVIIYIVLAVIMQEG